MLDDADIDAVFILTSGSHAPIAVAAANAGKHILVEKPMCFSVAEGLEMKAAADAAGVTLMVAYPKRYDPAFERFRDIAVNVADPRLMRVTTFESPFLPYIGHYALAPVAPIPQEAIATFTARPRPASPVPSARRIRSCARSITWSCWTRSSTSSTPFAACSVSRPAWSTSTCRPGQLTVILKFGELSVAINWMDLPGITRYGMEFALYGPQQRVTLSFPSPFLRSAPATVEIVEGEIGTTKSRSISEIISYDSAFKLELEAFHDCVVDGRGAHHQRRRRHSRPRAVRGHHPVRPGPAADLRPERDPRAGVRQLEGITNHEQRQRNHRRQRTRQLRRLRGDHRNRSRTSPTATTSSTRSRPPATRVSTSARSATSAPPRTSARSSPSAAWAWQVPTSNCPTPIPEMLEKTLPELDAMLDIFDSIKPLGLGPDPRPTLADLGVGDGADVRRNSPGSGARNPASGYTEDQWAEFARGMAIVVERCRSRGYQPVFHNETGTFVEAPEEVGRMLEVSEIGLCMDAGHFLLGGGDPVEYVKKWANRIDHVHIKTADLPRFQQVVDEGLPTNAIWEREVFPKLGEGALDVDAFLAALREIDYAGWMVVEQDIFPTTAERFAQAAADQRANREFLRERGL